jgi:hypothetical protein
LFSLGASWILLVSHATKFDHSWKAGVGIVATSVAVGFVITPYTVRAGRHPFGIAVGAAVLGFCLGVIASDVSDSFRHTFMVVVTSLWFGSSAYAIRANRVQLAAPQ